MPSILPAAGNSGWYLLELDQPFDYQIKVGEPYQFRGTTITHFLIRSRWLVHALGGPEPVSVFVLLVEDGSVPTQGETVAYETLRRIRLLRALRDRNHP